MSFGDRLKAFREAKGLTQTQLAELIGVAKTTITGYERGNREPDVMKIKKLATVLGVSGDDLLDTGYGKDSTSPALRESSKGLSSEFDGCSDIALKEMAVKIVQNLNQIFNEYRQISSQIDVRPSDTSSRESETIELLNYCNFVHHLSSEIGQIADNMAMHIQKTAIDEILEDWKIRYQQ